MATEATMEPPVAEKQGQGGSKTPSTPRRGWSRKNGSPLWWMLRPFYASP